MSEGGEPDQPRADIELPKTRLRVAAGELVRTAADGKVSMRLALDDIEGAKTVRWFDPTGLLFVGVGVGLAAIGFGLCEDRWLVISLAVAGLLCVLFGLVGAINDGLEVRVRGENVRVICTDPSDVVARFAAALRTRVGGRSPE